MKLMPMIERIQALEEALAPFAKLGEEGAFPSNRPASAVALSTLGGSVTVGDFRRAADVLRHGNADALGADNG